MADQREELLRKAIERCRDRPLREITLRSLAAEIGTSHRMLIYHFGSRDRLLAAVLHRIRLEEQRAFMAEAARGDRASALERLWRHYADPAGEHRLRAFFHVLGMAAEDPEPFREFLDSLNDWPRLLAELGVREGLDPGTARAEAELVAWTVRGLLLALVTTGDRDAVERALASLRASLSR
ncbi:TetR/AcrR family transcriptional regulator [Nocardiopsis composta]|uniref:AcrR family transcriptional regulator n=1 Tax=Nocardiopsis composta TaxID=157465 RepID=A0A7W8QHQ9_9ACTN|nr:TetR family transcriptional regulator [Nocardiopsis composta]MBB5430429.1 AcrR family transcriptional regulator [Nocardiopsis composta]